MRSGNIPFILPCNSVPLIYHEYTIKSLLNFPTIKPKENKKIKIHFVNKVSILFYDALRLLHIYNIVKAIEIFIFLHDFV